MPENADSNSQLSPAEETLHAMEKDAESLGLESHRTKIYGGEGNDIIIGACPSDSVYVDGGPGEDIIACSETSWMPPSASSDTGMDITILLLALGGLAVASVLGWRALKSN